MRSEAIRNSAFRLSHSALKKTGAFRSGLFYIGCWEIIRHVAVMTNTSENTASSNSA